MLIPVQYRDGRFDMVKNQMLDEMIQNKEIMLFRRQSGWVVVERDALRRLADSDRYYTGAERRSQLH